MLTGRTVLNSFLDRLFTNSLFVPGAKKRKAAVASNLAGATRIEFAKIAYTNITKQERQRLDDSNE